jgi:AcrR family transcriptional regulator
MRADVQRNRDALLVSATQAFAERGVDASLEDIARAAGVGSATLYRHFPTRESLIAAAYRAPIEALCAAADDLLEHLEPDAALAAWMRRVVSYVLERRGLGAALKATVCGTQEMRDLRDGLHAAAERLVAGAVERGLVRADAEARDALEALGGILFFEDLPDASARGTRLVSLFVDGLRYGAVPDNT